MMNEQDRTLSIDECVLPLFSSWEVWLSLDLLSCSLLRPSAVSGHLLDVCAPPKHTQGDKRREHKLEMLSSLQIWKCFGAITISASVQFLKTVCRPKSKLCIDSIHAARVLVGLVCVCVYLLCSLPAHGQSQLQLQLLFATGLRSGLFQLWACVGGCGWKTKSNSLSIVDETASSSLWLCLGCACTSE